MIACGSDDICTLIVSLRCINEYCTDYAEYCTTNDEYCTEILNLCCVVQPP